MCELRLVFFGFILLVLGFRFDVVGQDSVRPTAPKQIAKDFVPLSDIKCEGEWTISVEIEYPDRAGSTYEVGGEKVNGPDVVAIDNDWGVIGKLKITGVLSEPQDDDANVKLVLDMQMVEVLDLTAKDNPALEEIRRNKKFNWSKLSIDDPDLPKDDGGNEEDPAARDRDKVRGARSDDKVESEETVARRIAATQTLELKFELPSDAEGRVNLEIPFQFVWRNFTGVKAHRIYAIRATHAETSSIRIRNKRSGVVQVLVDEKAQRKATKLAVYRALQWMGFHPDPFYWFKD